MKPLLKTILLLLVTCSLSLISAPPVQATLPDTCTTNGSGGIKTALGCLSYEPETFLKQIVPWSVRLAGGVAFILILLGAFQYSTASGDPEKMQAAQELLSSAATGLFIIIIATILLKAIGVDLFGLDTLGF